MIWTTLLFGLLMGLRHALEVDHVAAVASLAARSGEARRIVGLGALWGLGHTLTLFTFGMAVLLLDAVIPQRLALSLELAVGVLLVILGGDIVGRMILARVHFHVHRHADGVRHFHAHSHAGERGHDPARHEHVHPQGLPLRALVVGLVHGMAGSAALILLVLQEMDSVLLGLVYMALFALGSVFGMAALSTVIAVPLAYSARRLTLAYNWMQGLIGLATLALGTKVLYEVAVVKGLLA